MRFIITAQTRSGRLVPSPYGQGNADYGTWLASLLSQEALASQMAHALLLEVGSAVNPTLRVRYQLNAPNDLGQHLAVASVLETFAARAALQLVSATITEVVTRAVEGLLVGAGVGAAGGGLVAGRSGEDASAGAVVGGALLSALGGLIGNAVEREVDRFVVRRDHMGRLTITILGPLLAPQGQ